MFYLVDYSSFSVENSTAKIRNLCELAKNIFQRLLKSNAVIKWSPKGHGECDKGECVSALMR